MKNFRSFNPGTSAYPRPPPEFCKCLYTYATDFFYLFLPPTRNTKDNIPLRTRSERNNDFKNQMKFSDQIRFSFSSYGQTFRDIYYVVCLLRQSGYFRNKYLIIFYLLTTKRQMNNGEKTFLKFLKYGVVVRQIQVCQKNK